MELPGLVKLRQINIYSAPLKIKEEDILYYNCKDEGLVTAIDDFIKKELNVHNIEIFKQIDNILITESGYFFTLFEDEVDNVNLPVTDLPWQDKENYKDET